MRAIRLILPAALLLMTMACQKNGPDEPFLENNDICLKVNGKVVHQYDPVSWQLGFSEDLRQFRVHNDNMSEYFIFTCASLPAQEGDEVKADLKWTDCSGIQTRSALPFRLEKKEGSRYWLWNRSKKIGVCLMKL